MNKLKRIVFALLATASFAMPAFAPVAVRAQNIDGGLECGADLNFSAGVAGDECEASNEGAGEQVDNIVANVINILSLVVGTVSVIMIIIAGLRYVTSSGESGNVTGAKNTIMYAVIGLVVVALAQIIVRFVVNQSTEGATLSE